LGRLPGDGDPFALAAALFEQIGDRDRVVLGADLAVAVVVDEKLIAAEPGLTLDEVRQSPVRDR